MSLEDLVLLGDAADARGFRLAGVRTVVCRERADVARAIRQLTAPAPRAAGVVMVSAAVYRLSPAAIDALSAGPRGRMVLVLPASTDGGSR